MPPSPRGRAEAALRSPACHPGTKSRKEKLPGERRHRQQLIRRLRPLPGDSEGHAAAALLVELSWVAHTTAGWQGHIHIARAQGTCHWQMAHWVTGFRREHLGASGGLMLGTRPCPGQEGRGASLRPRPAGSAGSRTKDPESATPALSRGQGRGTVMPAAKGGAGACLFPEEQTTSRPRGEAGRHAPPTQVGTAQESSRTHTRPRPSWGGCTRQLPPQGDKLQGCVSQGPACVGPTPSTRLTAGLSHPHGPPSVGRSKGQGRVCSIRWASGKGPLRRGDGSPR